MMNFQKRFYKFNAEKKEMHSRITDLADNSNLVGSWIDENNFILTHKSPFTVFHLEGDITEIEDKGKLKIFVKAGYRYILLYTLPFGLILYGLLKWSNDFEKGMLWFFTGVSLSVFVFLFTSFLMHKFKDSFKRALKII
jgi:hypothetical protein